MLNLNIIGITADNLCRMVWQRKQNLEEENMEWTTILNSDLPPARLRSLNEALERSEDVGWRRRQRVPKGTLLHVDYSVRPSAEMLYGKIHSHPHRKDQRTIDPSKIQGVRVAARGELTKIRGERLALHSEQITGHEMLGRLKASPHELLDIRVMEEFRKNTRLIDLISSWTIDDPWFFWGTICKNGSRLYAPCMHLDGNGGWRCLDRPFNFHCPAACL